MENNDKITFVTPSNLKFEVPFDKLNEFCKKYVETHISKSEENLNDFLEFKKSYTYFDPYYDYIICVLKWICVPSLLDKNSYIKGKDRNSKKVLSLLTIDNLDYDTLANKEIGTTLLNHNDENLGMNLGEVDYIDGFLDKYGTFMTNYKTHFHEETAKIILYGKCIEDGKILKEIDKMDIGRGIFNQDYLIYKLGYVLFGSYRGVLRMYYNRRLVSAKQRKVIREFMEMGYFPDAEVPPAFLSEEEKRGIIK